MLGLVLAWISVRDRRPWMLSAAFWLMSIKPTNVILPALFIMWAARRWPWRDWLRVISLPAISLVLSSFIIGFDWPLRWVDHLQRDPLPINMRSSIWRGAVLNNIPVWVLLLGVVPVVGWGIWRVAKYGVNAMSFAFALSLWMVVSPHTLGYHYVTLPLR